MLKVEGLKAGYGAINILWDLSFEVHEGEIVAILGSNGAGKTTMVRAITGMVRPSAGSVNFNGEELAKKSSRYILDKGIVQVPEGRQIFTDMTVLENLEMGAFSKPTKATFPKNLEAGEPGDGRLQQAHEGRLPEEPRNRVPALSQAEGTREAGGGHAVRRRAADAGCGPGTDWHAEAADPG